MFASEAEKLVEQLIQAEYQNACENWGEKYNSLHEGYAVLLEEVEEVDLAVKNVKIDTELIWALIKNNCLTDSKLDRTISDIKEAIKELAQVGAVVRKIRTTKDEVEE